MQSAYHSIGLAPIRAEGELAALLQREGLRLRFDDGAVIQLQGDDGDGFWLIEQGAVSLCRFGANGNVTVFGVLGPGDLFGELAHFAGLVRQVDAVSQGDVVLIRVDARLVDRLLVAEPAFARWLLKSLANQLRTALDRIDRDANLSALAHVTSALADMLARDGRELQITQQALADRVGVSRVTVGQILGRLARSGVIQLGYRRIVINQPAALERFRHE